MIVAVSAVGAMMAALSVQPTSAAPAPVARSAASAPVASPVAARAGRYTPRPGVILNNPLVRKRKFVINNHIRGSIDSSPRGSKIRIMSWNVKSLPYRRALIRAHNRGVSVRVIMSNGMAQNQSSSGDYANLRRAFSQHQAKRRPAMKSWMRACRASCRGWTGIAHVKFYTFSRAGRAKDVVMVGSANMTEVAGANQWNDMFTVVGKHGLWVKYQQIFGEASKDVRAHPPYQTYQVDKHLKAWFLPYKGTNAGGDPVMNVLKQVHCKGATGRSGIKGRTAVRIGQTAILDQRGQAIAQRLKNMWNWGCDIRITYTVLGPAIEDILKSKRGRGPVPMRQIAQDFDGDGSFDRYLHLKDMTISGVFGKQTDAHVVYNGTQNWTQVSFDSDEAGFLVRREGLERKYAAFINHLFENPPKNPYPVPLGTAELRGRGMVPKDPYSEVEIY